MIIVHCTDVSYRKVKNQLASVNAYHRDVRGFNRSTLGYNVGYHSLITDGKEYICRADEEYGNHCNQKVGGKSLNFQSLGVCAGFDGDIEYPPEKDVDLLRARIKSWQAKWNIPNERVRLHRDFATDKTCPGTLITDVFVDVVLLTEKPPEQIDKQAQIIELQQRITLIGIIVELRRILSDLLSKRK